MEINLISVDTSVLYENYKKYLYLISDKRQDKIENLKRNSDKIISFFSELLIKYSVCKKYDIEYKNIFFEYNKYGKPLLKGMPYYNFSVSHSENMIVFADNSEPIGIDIEIMGKSRLNTAKHFFTENEYNFILDSTNRDEAFYRIWTSKEAYVKMIGTGLSKSFRSFNVLDNEFSNYFISEKYKEYMITVCCENIGEIKINHMTDKDIMEYFKILMAE